MTLWGLRPDTPYNPCPLPVSLEARHLATLASEPYVVGAKLDGVRYLLLLTRYPPHLGGHQVAVLVDRAWCMYPLYVAAHSQFFDQGSLFDGELTRVPVSGTNQHRHLLFLFDAVCIAGENMVEAPFLRRSSALQSLFFCCNEDDTDMLRNPKQWMHTTGPRLAQERTGIVSLGSPNFLGFRTKQWFGVHNIETPWRCGAQADASWDGLIFMPLMDRVQTRRHDRMFKWKQRHTIDLAVSPDGMTLQHYSPEARANVCEPLQVEGRHYSVVCSTLPLPLEVCGGIAEFALTEHVPQGDAGADLILLTFLMHRPDKLHANDTRTVTGAMHNFLYPVELGMLVAACRENTAALAF